MEERLQRRKRGRYSDELRLKIARYSGLSSASRYFTMELGHPVSVSTVIYGF